MDAFMSIDKIDFLMPRSLVSFLYILEVLPCQSLLFK